MLNSHGSNPELFNFCRCKRGCGENYCMVLLCEERVLFNTISGARNIKNKNKKIGKERSNVKTSFHYEMMKC